MMNGGGQTGVQNMRIAVIGAGGVGGGFGAALAKAGADVTFVARGAHLAAMREHGLRVEGDRGETLINPVQATDDPASVGPVDIVLFCVKLWDIESAGELMKHKGVALLVVTGGPGVVKAAMASGKKAICAGPGNPPAVVDATADLVKAGKDLVAGASFDNNVICTDEKEILAVDSIVDVLKKEMTKNGAFELSASQAQAVTTVALPESEKTGPGRHSPPNKDLVGKDPFVIARAAGIDVPAETRILLMDVPQDHPLVWSEQLMPVIPLVRMRNVDEAIDLAARVEHGFRHTASIHSHDIEKLSRMAKVMNCSIFVKNGPNFAGLGEGGAGYASFTIASPTGEGVTRARTFTRERRCTLVDYFRII